MPLNIGFQMDSLECLNFKDDTTIAIITECLSKNCKVWHFLPRDVSYLDGSVYSACKNIYEIDGEKLPYYKCGDLKNKNLKDMDIIFIRQDPPFDMSYITSTYLLEYIENDVKIINRPSQIRNSPEKIFLNNWKNLTPRTLITQNTKEILNFREEHKNIIIKPLYGNGGSGIFYIKKDDKNFNSLIEMFQKVESTQFIVQEYLPEITQGDKRVILFDGEPVGAINRIPSTIDIRANMHVGGKAIKTNLSKNDLEICETIGPTLKENGLFFVGIDIIGEKLTEINVTSPTGFREIQRLTDFNLAKLFLEELSI
ncbi:MAG: glutathione synthase [SAR116 cluster bacterium]|nr:glutathione synthase [SAR116 cluster bacterium]